VDPERPTNDAPKAPLVVRHRPRLNKRQTKFVARYLETHNGAASARWAGYSRKTARTRAWTMLQFPAVQAALQEASARVQEKIVRQPKVMKDAEVSAARVLSEVAKMANYDHRAISPEQRYRYKLPANELLARHLGMVQAAAIATGPLFSINIHTTPRGAAEAARPVLEVMAEQLEEPDASDDHTHQPEVLYGTEPVESSLSEMGRGSADSGRDPD
jgi:hypothetical protein